LKGYAIVVFFPFSKHWQERGKKNNQIGNDTMHIVGYITWAGVLLHDFYLSKKIECALFGLSGPGSLAGWLTIWEQMSAVV
jgi:hypothetical protein